MQRVRYVFKSGRFAGSAKPRAFYWVVIRRWETEICTNCGRPVRQVWWCHDPALWTRITGHEPHGQEAAAGILCIRCFDEACQRLGVAWIEWAPVNIRNIGL